MPSNQARLMRIALEPADAAVSMAALGLAASSVESKMPAI